jgi:hypothetical protein
MGFGKSKRKSKNEWVSAEDALIFALGFMPEDLAANQDGKLSLNQRGLLNQRQGYWFAAGVLSFLLLLWSLVNAGWRLDAAIGQGNIAWIIVAAIAVVSAYKWKQYRDDLNAPEIGAAQGRVELDIRSSNNASSFSVKIGDVNFGVKKDAFLAFKNGDPYVIYYALYTKTLLSAEWLRGEE